jgi:hypothetical protein
MVDFEIRRKIEKIKQVGRQQSQIRRESPFKTPDGATRNLHRNIMNLHDEIRNLDFETRNLHKLI